MKKKWWRSLRIKIIAWSFVPTVIILSAVAWFTYYSYQQVLVDQAMKQDWGMVQSDADKINLAIAGLINPIVLPIILDIDIQKDDPIEIRAQKILDQAKYLEVFDGGIYFLDGQGKIFKTWPERPEMIGQDWSGTPAMRFIEANPGRGAFTDLRSVGSSGQEIICLAQSMNGPQGEYVGAFYVCFTINPPAQNTFSTLLTSLDLGADVIIMDGNQHILYSPDPSQLGVDLSEETYIQELLQAESGSIRFKSGAEEMVLSHNPVDSEVNDRNRWIIFRTQNLAEIMQPSLPNRQLLLVLLALGVIVPVAVTAYGVRHITDPIERLIQVARLVTAGQFKQRIEVNTGDEIEELADQFNLMSAELDESYSSLEKKVADRTRELAILNSIISVAGHSLDIQEILEDALNKTVEKMGFESGAAFRSAAGPAPAHLVACRGFEPASVVDLVRSDAARRQANPEEPPSKVTSYEIEDWEEDQQVAQLTRSGFRLLVFVPLATKGRTLGFFLLGKHALSHLSPEELALLTSIGKHVGVALENAGLYEQAEQTAITTERNRLARELHDAVTQTLFSASLIADVLPTIWKRNPDEGLQNLEELRQLTRGALAEMRTMLLEMRPEALERADLKTLLTQLADAFVGRVRIPLDLEINGDCTLTHEVKIAFYRVAQEALNNIARHSGARQVEMRLECQPGQMCLLIKDDGLGFDLDSVPPDHLGIAIMRERAASIGASLQIESQIGLGTTVELEWRTSRKEGTDEYISKDPGDAG